jgi:hypothetical protein
VATVLVLVLVFMILRVRVRVIGTSSSAWPRAAQEIFALLERFRVREP